MNARHGLTEHRACLQPLPDGSYGVLVIPEGPGSASFLPSVMASDHEPDRWFVGSIAEIHGMDGSGPVPPLAERRLWPGREWWSTPARVILRATAARSSRRTERSEMPLYLSRFSYTPETWARLIANPEDRRTAAQSYIESVGGTLHGFWYAFGSHDGYNLWEAPDNVSMAAVALAIGGGGALSSFETTVLMSVDETMDALRKAQEIRYRAPAAAPDS